MQYWRITLLNNFPEHQDVVEMLDILHGDDEWIDKGFKEIYNG